MDLTGQEVAIATLVVAAITGLYRIHIDRRKAKDLAESAQKLLISEAEERAYARARLEAVAREAENAVEALKEENAEKDRIIERLRSQVDMLMGAMEDLHPGPDNTT